jgi:small subunit ribosomal protein S7
MEENKKDLNMVLKKTRQPFFSTLPLLEANLMRGGNRATAARNVIISLRKFKGKSFSVLANSLKLGLLRSQPLVRMLSKKVGGGVYRIPVYILPNKAKFLAVKWIVRSSCGRKLGASSSNLCKELQAIFIKAGPTLQKRKTLHNLAVANRAYIKYL